jgi:hypothetical protein
LERQELASRERQKVNMRQVKILQLRSKILPVIRQGITTDDKGKMIKIKS